MFQEALQSPCKIQEGFGKATLKTPACSQHLKQQEVPEVLSKPESSRAGNLSLWGDFKAHFADLCDPEIAFLGSLTPADLCYTESLDPGAWQGVDRLGSTEIQPQIC